MPIRRRIDESLGAGLTTLKFRKATAWFPTMDPFIASAPINSRLRGQFIEKRPISAAPISITLIMKGLWLKIRIGPWGKRVRRLRSRF